MLYGFEFYSWSNVYKSTGVFLSLISVARVSVLVHNVAVILCCLAIYVVFEHKSWVTALLPSTVIYAFIIGIAISSNLVNMARKTAIERDWIVEICAGDKDMLAG